jgi:hypothetical protein
METILLILAFLCSGKPAGGEPGKGNPIASLGSPRKEQRMEIALDTSGGLI